MWESDDSDQIRIEFFGLNFLDPNNVGLTPSQMIHKGNTLESELLNKYTRHS